MSKLFRLILINLGIFLGLICVIIVCAELFFHTQNKTRQSYRPKAFKENMGIIFKPNSTMFSTNNVDFFQENKVNSLGFVDREFIAKEHTQKIVIVGDSFVEALQVPNEKKFQITLENMLNTATKNTQYQTIAFGYSGTGQINQLSYYEPYIKAIKPSIVVLVICHNDIPNNSPILESLRQGYDLECQPFTTSVAQGDSFALKAPCPQFNERSIDSNKSMSYSQEAITFLHKNSSVYRYISSILVNHFPKLAFLTPQTMNIDDRVNARLKKLMSTKYKEMLSHEKDLSYISFDYAYNKINLTPLLIDALNRTDFAFATWKKHAQEDGFKLLALLAYSASNCDETSLYKQHITRILDKYDIPYADQCTPIRAAQKTWREAFFKFDGHWSEQGHLWAAEALFPLIYEVEKLKNIPSN